MAVPSAPATLISGFGKVALNGIGRNEGFPSIVPFSIGFVDAASAGPDDD